MATQLATNRVELGSERILKPGKLRWVRALLWAVLLFLFLSLASTTTLLLFFRAQAITPAQVASFTSIHGPTALAGTVIMAFVTIGLYGGAVTLGEKRAVTELAPAPAVPEILAGLAIGALMMAIVVAGLWVTGWAVLARSPVRGAWWAVAMSVQSGVVEEILLRLVVFRLVWRAFGMWPALILSALLFGALHLANPNASLFAALCIMIEAGIMLAGFYILTGRLWVSIGVHAGWNFTQGWIFGADVSGTDVFLGGPFHLTPAPAAASFLSGGAFGPEASLPGLLVGTFVGLLTIEAASRRGRLAAGDDSFIAVAEEPRDVPLVVDGDTPD